jgi:uncharacterized membrane protein YedE/YeeE
MISVAALFFSGLVFALGLGISGMTLPAKVLGFLDVTSAWDPSLLFVMGTAIAVYALAHRLSLRAARPLLAATFPALPRQPVDRKLVLGAMLFGAGWGIAGVCPGPALVNLGGHAPGAALFVASMLGGMALQRWSSTRIPATRRPPTLFEKELT